MDEVAGHAIRNQDSPARISAISAVSQPTVRAIKPVWRPEPKGCRKTAHCEKQP